MTATCSTCRHWDRSNPDYVLDDEGNETWLPYGRCAQAESDDGAPKLGKVPVHPAYAIDASGYHASLRTLPTFGCNQHAPSAAAEALAAEMLPCPFCGRESSNGGGLVERHPETGHGPPMCVRCGNCGAIGPASRTQSSAAGEREAIANWNRRKPDPVLKRDHTPAATQPVAGQPWADSVVGPRVVLPLAGGEDGPSIGTATVSADGTVRVVAEFRDEAVACCLRDPSRRPIEARMVGGISFGCVPARPADRPTHPGPTPEPGQPVKVVTIEPSATEPWLVTVDAPVGLTVRDPIPSDGVP